VIKYHTEVEQGGETWLQLRCGLLTASEVSKIMTPTLKIANNDKTRAHVWEIAAQRITRHVEPYYVGDEMLRGKTDEFLARDLYDATYESVDEVGFITNDVFGFTIGYSPDGLVGMDGLIEVKSRRQRFQTETLATREVPEEYILQIQTGLLVSGRKWLDFVSYCGGMKMFTKRVYPDAEIQEAIVKAATAFEASVRNKIEDYFATCEAPDMRLIQTERVVEQEMV
jgi:predicted phage-related endonuclease